MIRLAFLLLGLFLFVYLSIQLGLEEVLLMLRRIGWDFLPIALIYGSYQMARAAALSKCLLTSGPVSYRDMLRIRLAGEAVQFLTFTGPFLAEPTKAWLLKTRGLTTREAFAATITEYLIYNFLAAALSIAGLLYLAGAFDLAAALSTVAMVIVYVMAAFLLVSIWAILFRVYLIGGIVRWMARLPVIRRYGQPDMEWIHRLEDLLLGVLRDRPAQLLTIVTIEVMAHTLLIFELYWILRAFDLSFPLAYPFLIEAVTKFTSLAFFFIPTQLGAAEGTYAVVFDVLGLAAAGGFALAFVRRLRSLVVAGGGLLSMALLSRRERRVWT